MKTKLKFILILSILATVAKAEASDVVVKSVTGTAEYILPGSSAYQPLKEGKILSEGSKIRTGRNGLVFVSVIPGVAMRVSGETELTVAQASSSDQSKVPDQATIQLNQGAIHALIEKIKQAQPDFKVETPQGMASARGTFFGVYIEKDGTYVGVKEGRVKITPF